MKAIQLPKLAGLVVTGLALFALFITGCRSTPKVDWNSRVGSYTYDQAVVELGVPDKTADLSDGRKIAEWITHRSSGGAFSFGVGGYSSNTGVGVSQTVGTGGQVRSLRLTFDEQGRLTAWARN